MKKFVLAALVLTSALWLTCHTERHEARAEVACVASSAQGLAASTTMTFGRSCEPTGPYLSFPHAQVEDPRSCKRCGHALNAIPKDDNTRFDAEGNRVRRRQYEGAMSYEVRVTDGDGTEVFDGCLWCLTETLRKSPKK